MQSKGPFIYNLELQDFKLAVEWKPEPQAEISRKDEPTNEDNPPKTGLGFGDAKPETYPLELYVKLGDHKFHHRGEVHFGDRSRSSDPH